MENFQLQFLFKIIGIGSASGLLFQNDSLFVISDSSSFLYEYSMSTKELSRIKLTENAQENIPKKDKPDFEAMTHFGNSLYLFGSGSTEKRNKRIEVDIKTKEAIASTDLTDLYMAMQRFGEIKAEDFNIEGAIFNGETWFLFNRGNGKSNQNTVFSIQGKNLSNEFSILVNDFKLPKIKGVRSSFTDAILVDNKIYFLATAEDAASTYDDGEIAGSLIGRIDLEKMKIDFTQKISTSHKFEGLTLFSNSDSQIEFLLCEDKDTETLESNIYKLTLNKE